MRWTVTGTPKINRPGRGLVNSELQTFYDGRSRFVSYLVFMALFMAHRCTLLVRKGAHNDEEDEMVERLLERLME